MPKLLNPILTWYWNTLFIQTLCHKTFRSHVFAFRLVFIMHYLCVIWFVRRVEWWCRCISQHVVQIALTPLYDTNTMCATTRPDMISFQSDQDGVTPYVIYPRLLIRKMCQDKDRFYRCKQAVALCFSAVPWWLRWIIWKNITFEPRSRGGYYSNVSCWHGWRPDEGKRSQEQTLEVALFCNCCYRGCLAQSLNDDINSPRKDTHTIFHDVHLNTREVHFLNPSLLRGVASFFILGHTHTNTHTVL